ncbi:MAG: MurR/RpiR family transcriptional regulator [Rhodobacteraceae bacterium]|nr:MurR/RpiR family transcriptional regulator [Paracoccaceae bacterium]
MTQIIDIISRMKELDGSLHKREQLVANFILSNLEQISFLSQEEIANAAKVSVATVNRLCISVGCKGFRDFKIHLVQSVAVSMPYLGSNGQDKSETGQLVAQVFNGLIETLSLVQSQLASETIESATGILCEAKRIVFFGVGGGSANVAREGANRFFRLGIPAEAHSDGIFQRMLVSTLGPGDVVFCISASGQPIELLDSVAIANQYGASTVCLTKTGSELAKNCDVAIELDVPEDQNIFKPSASRLVFSAIIDVLAAGTAQKRPERVKEYLRRIRTSLVQLHSDTGPGPIGD